MGRYLLAEAAPLPLAPASILARSCSITSAGTTCGQFHKPQGASSGLGESGGGLSPITRGRGACCATSEASGFGNRAEALRSPKTNRAVLFALTLSLPVPPF